MLQLANIYLVLIQASLEKPPHRLYMRVTLNLCAEPPPLSHSFSSNISKGKNPEQNECIINEKRHSTKFYTIRKNVELLYELFFH